MRMQRSSTAGRSILGASAVIALLLVGSGCSDDDGSAGPTTSARADAAATVEVTFNDEGVSISGPARPGGSVRVRNDDEQMHMFLLARLHEDRTLEDATEALQSEDESAMDSVADPVGAPSTHLPPGMTVEVTSAGLTAGHYIVADFYPREGGDGTPNVFVNGLAELIVEGAPIDDNEPGDATYAVTAGQPISGPAQLTAGRQRLTFTGLSGEDGKEISIWRLNEGDTVPAVQAELFEIFDANDGEGLAVDGAGRRVADHVLCWVLPPDEGGPLTLTANLDAGTYALVAADIDADDASATIVEHLTVTVA